MTSPSHAAPDLMTQDGGTVTSRVQPEAAIDIRPNMRVQMVITSYHPIVGGAEKQVAQLAQLMQGMGHQVSVVTRHHPGLELEEVVDGIPVRRVPARGPGPLAAFDFILGGVRAVRAAKPDVIHCHSLFTPSLIGNLTKRLTGVPLLAKPMCGGEATSIRAKPLGGWRIADMERRADRFIAVSGEIEEELTSLGIPAAKIRRIPNGVDLGRFRPFENPEAKRALRQELGLPDGVLFMFAGRVAAQKRLPLLLEIWPTVLEAAPEAKLLIAGANRKTSANNSVDTAETVPDALLHQPGVELLGHVNDMPTYLRAADVFVLPSAREGLSNALLEACASGLPTVSARIGGAEDFIVSGQNGMLFGVEDRSELANAMIDLARSADLRASMGRSARGTVTQQYDISVTAERLLQEYSALLRSTS